MMTMPMVIALAAIIGMVDALNNGMGLIPPLGWSTWCNNGPCGNDYCDETTVLSSARALQMNGMFSLGYRWIILDDCWAAGQRTSNGTLTWDLTRFPSGIPKLIEQLHKMNFSFGLYTSAGNVTCSSGGRGYPIPGSEGHFVEDSNTFALWGVDYVKVDWCGDVQHLPLDGIAVGAKYYTEFSKALTTTTPRRPMFFEAVAAYLFLFSETPTFVNSWRASTDHHDSWSNLIGVLATVELVGLPSAPGAWSYMDVLMTGGQGCDRNSTAHCPGMTEDEYYAEFALWSIYQSPLIVATDVRNMTAVMNNTLKNRMIVSFHQSTATPPGKLNGGDEACGELGALTCQFFTREVVGGWLAVLLNAGAESHVITFPFSRIGGNGTSRAVVMDLYTNTKSVVIGNVSMSTPSHGVKYLFITM